MRLELQCFSLLTVQFVIPTQTEVAKYSPELVEDRIRLAALAKRIRTTEFFKDFDKLRTGFITSECFSE